MRAHCGTYKVNSNKLDFFGKETKASSKKVRPRPRPLRYHFEVPHIGSPPDTVSRADAMQRPCQVKAADPENPSNELIISEFAEALVRWASPVSPGADVGRGGPVPVPLRKGMCVSSARQRQRPPNGRHRGATASIVISRETATPPAAGKLRCAWRKRAQRAGTHMLHLNADWASPGGASAPLRVQVRREGVREGEDR